MDRSGFDERLAQATSLLDLDVRSPSPSSGWGAGLGPHVVALSERLLEQHPAHELGEQAAGEQLTRFLIWATKLPRTTSADLCRLVVSQKAVGTSFARPFSYAVDALLLRELPDLALKLTRWRAGVVGSEGRLDSVMPEIEALRMVGNRTEAARIALLTLQTMPSVRGDISHAKAVDNCIRALGPADASLAYLAEVQLTAVETLDQAGSDYEQMCAWYNRAQLFGRFSDDQAEAESLEQIYGRLAGYEPDLLTGGLLLGAEIITAYSRALLKTGQSSAQRREALFDETNRMLQRAAQAGAAAVDASLRLFNAVIVEDGNHTVVAARYSPSTD